FAALRPGQDAKPLVFQYEISLVPSATLWLGWRKNRGAVAKSVPLVFADPETPAHSLGALPYARDEGKSVLRRFGGGELRQGREASEAWLKSAGLGGFGLLHFATHARTFDIDPDSSFVLLAPGSPKEDGSLHVREIARLPLAGRTVVLSSCESAAGEILRGEGVMGLARAFFQAGAHTVVASLWPLRDDDGAALFDRFYRHLADGRTVSAALRAAQQDRIGDGAPAEAWAGVVVLGDGDRVPIPGGRKRPGVWVRVVGVLLAVSALLFSIAGRRWRRSRRSAG
ncbi:MAG TPA: CHAT domain-containing protein, partial [Thermoanaerobaculia bacterium]|nr:CHAT domain-containing protein [Thermoanaerobaculia bacterium]